jgi:hypothetical protein
MKEAEPIKDNTISNTVLSKYIQYIRNIEGVDYVLDLDQRGISEVKFTDEEWAILTEAAKNA